MQSAGHVTMVSKVVWLLALCVSRLTSNTYMHSQHQDDTKRNNLMLALLCSGPNSSSLVAGRDSLCCFILQSLVAAISKSATARRLPRLFERSSTTTDSNIAAIGEHLLVYQDTTASFLKGLRSRMVSSHRPSSFHAGQFLASQR